MPVVKLKEGDGRKFVEKKKGAETGVGAADRGGGGSAKIGNRSGATGLKKKQRNPGRGGACSRGWRSGCRELANST